MLTRHLTQSAKLFALLALVACVPQEVSEVKDSHLNNRDHSPKETPASSSYKSGGASHNEESDKSLVSHEVSLIREKLEDSPSYKLSHSEVEFLKAQSGLLTDEDEKALGLLK